MVNVARELILTVLKEKDCSARSKRFHFNSNEVKQRREGSQRFQFSVTYAKKIVFHCLVLQQQ